MPRARKRFGQHFLADPAVVDAIVAALWAREEARAGARAGEHVVEIGPGRGALTGALCAAGVRLTAIELDRDLVGPLRRRFPEVTVVQGDALAVDLAALAGGEPLRIVGNLPYNISTPLLNRLFDARAAGLPLVDMHFMLQAEVADRLCAAPGSKAWGRLSVIAQYHCAIEPLFEVSPDAFLPPPRVLSKFARLAPRQPAHPVDDVAALRTVLRVAFAARRKRLGNAVQSLGLDVAALGLDPETRPDAVGLGGFVAMANQLARNG